MRLIALGAGATGAVAARVAAHLPGLTSLLVADRDRAAADRMAASLARTGTEVATTTVDVSDATAVRALLAGGDVVVNTTGPFYRYGPDVLVAAIATGTHYLDICDDPAPTVSMLGLSGAATAAGVTAIVGAGASPGCRTSWPRGPQPDSTPSRTSTPRGRWMPAAEPTPRVPLPCGDRMADPVPQRCTSYSN